jgi:repressor LexA
MNMEIGEKIKLRRNELGWTQQQLADKMGYTSKSTIARIEKGNNDVAQKNIAKFAEVLNVSIAYLMDWTEEAESKPIRIPVLGRVAAGIPIEAIEEIIDYEEVDGNTTAPGELFGLLIKGNSMAPRICDKDVVIVRKQEAADSGDVVIATINGDDAVCKRLLIYGKTILLRSNNPEYEDIDVTGRTDFHIIGKVVELRGKF